MVKALFMRMCYKRDWFFCCCYWNHFKEMFNTVSPEHVWCGFFYYCRRKWKKNCYYAYTRSQGSFYHLNIVSVFLCHMWYVDIFSLCFCGAASFDNSHTICAPFLIKRKLYEPSVSIECLGRGGKREQEREKETERNEGWKYFIHQSKAFRVNNRFGGRKFIVSFVICNNSVAF